MLNPYVLATTAAIAYIFAVDGNVASYLVLQMKLLGINTRRAIWIIRLHPSAPWTRWSINRQAWRLAKELRQSFNLSDDESEVS